jgi:hypothetical protein
MTLRNVISTNAGSDVSKEYAEAVADLVDTSPERETYRLSDGQKDYRIALVSYPRPGTGEEVWAVDYHDPASRELEETGSRREAEDRYEELVHNDAQYLDVDKDGNPEIFDATDVAGVPGYTGIWYTIDTSSDGQIWQTIETAQDALDSAKVRGMWDQYGNLTWIDPHQQAAREILDNHLVDLDDAQVVTEAVETAADRAGTVTLQAAGRPVIGWRVRVYNGTQNDHACRPAAEADAYTR